MVKPQSLRFVFHNVTIQVVVQIEQIEVTILIILIESRNSGLISHNDHKPLSYLQPQMRCISAKQTMPQLCTRRRTSHNRPSYLFPDPAHTLQ